MFYYPYNISEYDIKHHFILDYTLGRSMSFYKKNNTIKISKLIGEGHIVTLCLILYLYV